MAADRVMPEPPLDACYSIILATCNMAATRVNGKNFGLFSRRNEGYFGALSMPGADRRGDSTRVQEEIEVATLTLTPQPLTPEGFSPFGDVIESAGHKCFPINFGHALRFPRLALVDCYAEAGEAVISIVRSMPWPVPIEIKLLERHPISSQAFVPLSEVPFLVVVAERDKEPDPSDIQAFMTNGRQGINYRRGTWHHPLLTLSEAEFLAIDRMRPAPDFDQDYEEICFEDVVIATTADGRIP